MSPAVWAKLEQAPYVSAGQAQPAMNPKSSSSVEGKGGRRGPTKVKIRQTAEEDIQTSMKPHIYEAKDVRFCTRCAEETTIIGSANVYARWWKCQQCQKRTAIQYLEASPHYSDGSLEHACMAVAGEVSEDGYATDDDEIARLDSMCTSTMHGDQWYEKFKAILEKRYRLTPTTEETNVKYRFGGGESKVATKSDTWPVGIEKMNGEISSNRIRIHRLRCSCLYQRRRHLGS